MIDLDRNREEAVYAGDEIVLHLIYPFNEAIENTLVEAIAALRRTKYYRTDLKKYSNNAKRSLHDLVTKQRTRFGKDTEYIYCEYVDKYSECMQHDIFMLYMTLNNELTKHNTIATEALAYFETTRVIMIILRQAFDEMFKWLEKKYIVNIKQYFTRYMCDGSYNWVEKIVDKLYSMQTTYFDVNENKNIDLAVSVIKNRIKTNEDILEMISKEIIHENPERIPKKLLEELNTEEDAK